MSSTKENELQPYQQLLDETEKPPMLSLPKMFYVAGTESQTQIGFVGFFFPHKYHGSNSTFSFCFRGLARLQICKGTWKRGSSLAGLCWSCLFRLEWASFLTFLPSEGFSGQRDENASLNRPAQRGLQPLFICTGIKVWLLAAEWEQEISFVDPAAPGVWNGLCLFCHTPAWRKGGEYSSQACWKCFYCSSAS